MLVANLREIPRDIPIASRPDLMHIKYILKTTEYYIFDSSLAAVDYIFLFRNLLEVRKQKESTVTDQTIKGVGGGGSFASFV